MTDTAIDSSVIPALFDTVAQWRAESMQVVNWGGFHGHRQVELSGTATLISGRPAPASRRSWTPTSR